MPAFGVGVKDEYNESDGRETPKVRVQNRMKNTGPATTEGESNQRVLTLTTCGRKLGFLQSYTSSEELDPASHQFCPDKTWFHPEGGHNGGIRPCLAPTLP
ncbi:hypothetical protein E2C01_091064 [Portunus trituberculatus]|uniref:Uncharacterized protein n=1 Tax=Portunus trituberculatus TaxID=210409 RepID=A0A5B7JNE1_PORTR|nr:hypothetical protein [Portunus trituberculatus]